MEPNNTTPQTPTQDVTPQAPATPATPPAPTNPGTGTGNQTPIRNNPDGGQQPTQPVNYEEKFGESTRENQRIMDILRKNGIDPKTGQPVQPGAPAMQPAQPTQNFEGSPEYFTDTQLNEAIPGFNSLSAAEKDVIRHAKNTAQTVASLQRMVAELYDAKTTGEQIERMKTNPQFKAVADNEKAFREYAYRQENLSLDIEHVAFKFMQELAAGTLQAATPANNQPPQPVQQPGMVPSAGGSKQVNTPGGEPGVREMTAAEAADLRRTNHREYNKLAATGKLKIVSR